MCSTPYHYERAIYLLIRLKMNYFAKIALTTILIGVAFDGGDNGVEAIALVPLRNGDFYFPKDAEQPPTTVGGVDEEYMTIGPDMIRRRRDVSSEPSYEDEVPKNRQAVRRRRDVSTNLPLEDAAVTDENLDQTTDIQATVVAEVKDAGSNAKEAIKSATLSAAKQLRENDDGKPQLRLGDDDIDVESSSVFAGDDVNVESSSVFAGDDEPLSSSLAPLPLSDENVSMLLKNLQGTVLLLATNVAKNEEALLKLKSFNVSLAPVIENMVQALDDGTLFQQILDSGLVTKLLTNHYVLVPLCGLAFVLLTAVTSIGILFLPVTLVALQKRLFNGRYSKLAMNVWEMKNLNGQQA